MKNNNKQTKQSQTDNSSLREAEIKAAANTVDDTEAIEHQEIDEVAATAAQYRHEDNQRKVALILSLMGNIFFLVTAYTILCYDGTGRLFGRLLGINL